MPIDVSRLCGSLTAHGALHELQRSVIFADRRASSISRQGIEPTTSLVTFSSTEPSHHGNDTPRRHIGVRLGGPRCAEYRRFPRALLTFGSLADYHDTHTADVLRAADRLWLLSRMTGPPECRMQSSDEQIEVSRDDPTMPVMPARESTLVRCGRYRPHCRVAGRGVFSPCSTQASSAAQQLILRRQP